MSKKVLAMGLVSCFAVMSLASCGNHSAEIVVPEVNVLGYDSIKDKGDDAIEINFWHGFGKDKEAALNKQIEKFEELYPFIKVNAETQGGYDGLKEAVSLAIPTGEYPDVVLGYPDHFAEYISAGIVAPLDGFMNSEDPEVGIGEGAHNAKNDFFENYMTENRQYVDNLTFGLPFNKSTEVAIYNKTIFDEFNIELPKTWQEVGEVSQKIKDAVSPYFGKDEAYVCKNPNNVDKHGNPIKLNFKDVKTSDCRPITYDSNANCFITLTKDFGGKYTEIGDNIEQGYIEFDNPQTKEALQMLKDLSSKVLYGIPDNWEEKYCSTMFKNLKSFYTVGSSAGADFNIPDGDAFKVGVAPVPYFDDGKGTVRKNVIQQGTNIGMLTNNTDEEKLASWLLIRFLTAYHNEETKYDANAEFALDSAYLPVRESARSSDSYSKFLATDSSKLGGKQGIKIEAAKTAAKYDNTWNKFVDPAFVGSSAVRAACDQIIPSVTMTDKTPDQVIKETYNSLSAYVRK